MPTPGGVPVAITSPGISVMISDRYDTIFLTPKIMVAVDPVWQRWPFTSHHIGNFCTSAISSLVTSHGPSGPKVSCDLPLVHCPRRSIWKKRSETSLQTLYPATELRASASETYFARVPMMIAISTSQSSLVEPRGFSTLSFGPHRL